MVPCRPCGVSIHPLIQTETVASSPETARDSSTIHVGSAAHTDWLRPHNGTQGTVEDLGICWQQLLGGGNEETTQGSTVKVGTAL